MKFVPTFVPTIFQAVGVLRCTFLDTRNAKYSPESLVNKGVLNDLLDGMEQLWTNIESGFFFATNQGVVGSIPASRTKI